MLEMQEAGSREPGPSITHRMDDSHDSDCISVVSGMYNDGIPEPDNATGFLKPAMWYARMGFRIHPLQPGTKNHPRWSGWQERAASDLNEVRDWWRWHKADNIAVATGRGLVVIDLDVKNGDDGFASLRQWLIEHPEVRLPVAPVVRTTTGGAHLYFRTNQRVKSCPGWRPGVDVRGEGGYVVAPLSALRLMMDDGTHRRKEEVWLEYRLERGRLDQLPEMPDALLAAINTEGGSSTRAGGSGGSEGHGGMVIADLDVLLREGFRAGERDEGFYRLACRLWRKFGLDAGEEVTAALLAVWAVTDSSESNPFPWRFVEHKAVQARKFIAKQEQAENRFIRLGRELS